VLRLSLLALAVLAAVNAAAATAAARAERLADVASAAGAELADFCAFMECASHLYSEASHSMWLLASARGLLLFSTAGSVLALSSAMPVVARV
jgi:hypothetical protein